MNVRALPAPSPWLIRTTSYALLGLVVTAGVILAVSSIMYVFGAPDAPDRAYFLEATRRLHSGTLYELSEDYQFRWSPIAAWLLAVLMPLGVWGWRAIQLAALLTVRDWRIIGLALVTWPFWFDVQVAGIMVFVFVLAWHALAGSRLASLAYLALLLLVPRPLQVPVAAWLLWQRPDLRLPFAGMLIAAGVLTLLTGYADDWLGVLLGTAEREVYLNPLNFAPSRIVGSAWVLVGLPLAAVLTWKGRLGLASLAASPYWLPYYLLMGLLELRGHVSSPDDDDSSPRPSVPSLRRIASRDVGGS